MAFGSISESVSSLLFQWISAVFLDQSLVLQLSMLVAQPFLIWENGVSTLFL